jgi:hypothetical protein
MAIDFMAITEGRQKALADNWQDKVRFEQEKVNAFNDRGRQIEGVKREEGFTDYLGQQEAAAYLAPLLGNRQLAADRGLSDVDWAIQQRKEILADPNFQSKSPAVQQHILDKLSQSATLIAQQRLSMGGAENVSLAQKLLGVYGASGGPNNLATAIASGDPKQILDAAHLVPDANGKVEIYPGHKVDALEAVGGIIQAGNKGGSIAASLDASRLAAAKTEQQKAELAQYNQLKNTALAQGHPEVIPLLQLPTGYQLQNGNLVPVQDQSSVVTDFNSTYAALAAHPELQAKLTVPAGYVVQNGGLTLAPPQAPAGVGEAIYQHSLTVPGAAATPGTPGTLPAPVLPDASGLLPAAISPESLARLDAVKAGVTLQPQLVQKTAEVTALQSALNTINEAATARATPMRHQGMGVERLYTPEEKQQVTVLQGRLATESTALGNLRLAAQNNIAAHQAANAGLEANALSTTKLGNEIVVGYTLLGLDPAKLMEFKKRYPQGMQQAVATLNMEVARANALLPTVAEKYRVGLTAYIARLNSAIANFRKL